MSLKKGEITIIKKNKFDDILEWTKEICTKDIESGFAIDFDKKNNIILTGNYLGEKRYSSYLSKLDKNGNDIWSKAFKNNKQNMIYDVIFDSKENIITTGFEGEWTNAPTPHVKACVKKYDKNGDILWEKTFQRGICTIGFSVTTGPKDDIFVASTFFKPGEPTLGCLIVKYDKDGGVIWDKIYHEYHMDIPRNIQIDNKGNIVIVGYCYTPYKIKGKWMEGALVLKYDKNGNLIWSNRYGKDLGMEALGASIDSKNNIILSGRINFRKKMNPVVIKINEKGDINWLKTKKYNYNSLSYSIALDSHDEPIIGITSEPSKKVRDCIIKYSKNGNIKFISDSIVKRTIFDLKIDNDDSIIITGNTNDKKAYIAKIKNI